MSSQNQSSIDPVIHLVCGTTGAGKSTYANFLKKKFNAAHFAVDDWMIPLFGPDIEDPMDWDWISERATRCEDKILSIAIALAQTGTSSVMKTVTPIYVSRVKNKTYPSCPTSRRF